MKIKKIRPLFNRVVVTANRYHTDSNSGQIIVKTEGTLKEYQTVLAVGTTVRDIKVGDIVLINPTRYAQRVHQEGSLKDGIITDNPITRYNFNMLELNNEEALLLYDSDIEYIIEEKEED